MRVEMSHHSRHWHSVGDLNSDHGDVVLRNVMHHIDTRGYDREAKGAYPQVTCTLSSVLSLVRE